MNNEEKLLKECTSYFKDNQGFKRALLKIKEKYESLGGLGGTVVLSNLRQDEQEALTGLFRKDYYRNKSASIKAEAFVKALEDTRFSGVNFEKVLEAYFGQKLISKKEQRDIHEVEKQKFFEEIFEEFRRTRAESWLKFVLETKENAYKIIIQKYDEDKQQLRLILTDVCRGYNSLSFNRADTVRLALFASNITKNPHSFDENTDNFKLLVHALCYELNLVYPGNAEELSEILYKGGIIRDEVSNFTLCSGLMAYDKEKQHEGWRGFYETSEPLQVSLWNISRLKRIESPTGKVFIFENPTVFSEVLYRTSSAKPSLICTFGNFKLASLILMDKLVESGAVLHYSGDFDPEGIIMADKLKRRYGSRLVLWRYSEEEYLSIKSNIKLSDIRLKKLDSIESAELQAVAEQIRLHKRAGYQEMLIDRYVEDICR